MKPRPPLPRGPYLVVGLARSGRAAAFALRARGEEVIGVDAGAPDTGRLRDVGVEVHLDVPGTELVARARSVVKSPGVPQDAPVVVAARDRGLPVIGELEMAWRLIGNEVVAVTGTNGKTTTTELIGHMHREAGEDVLVAGNVGMPLADLLDDLEPGTTIIAEASSFQLEDTEWFAPEAAVLLNVAPDHLDRHGTMTAYQAAKHQAFARQESGDVAVAPPDLAAGLPGAAQRVCFGDGRDLAMGRQGGVLFWRGHEFVRESEVRLRGRHNLDNAMAAAAVCLARGLPANAVRNALRTFAGVEHRLEEVAEAGGVLYVNDSKATNPASTVVALDSFEDGVHLIAGGRAKGGGFADLVRPVALHCAAVYLIGEAAPALEQDLAPAGVPLHQCGDLATAVRAARAAAQPGETVLLSPACSSYDQFHDFEARGAAFKALAQEAA
jgi:UDP-N-acetylmuramoylalanine--D-glutamate ligase